MKGEYFMMKKHGLRRFFSLLLAVFMVCTLLPTAALAEDTAGDGETKPQTVVVNEDGETQKKEDTPPQNPEQGTPPADDDDSDEGSDSPLLTGSRPVTITVRVFSLSTGVDAVVGSDVAGAGKPGEIQSADYKIPPLTKFVDSSKFGSVTKVAGNWYFPSGDRQPGAIVQWSTNSGTATMTYWVDWYNPDGGGSTTYLWNFTLKYDANGGSGAPADQTWGTNDKYTRSHTFNIPSTVPTRAGYEFKGWSDTKGGSATRQPGGTCLVSQTVDGYNGGSVTKTLYAVWKENAPAQPTPLDEAGVKALLGENAVQIICTNTQSGHGSRTFGLIDGTFTVYQSNNRRYEVVINGFSSYMSKFDAAVNVHAGTHFTDNSMASQNRAKINLVWSNGKWTAADAPAKYHVLCTLQPAPSSPPTFDELVDILGPKAVKVVCTNAAAGHDEAAYALKKDTISNTSFSGGPNGHTYKFDINSAKYVAEYNETTNKTHTPKDATAHVMLVWENGKWTVHSGIPATFQVECVTEIVPPTEGWFIEKYGTVTVNCTNTPAGHGSKSYDLVPKSIEIGTPTYDSTNEIYSCVVTVTSTSYVAQFNKDKGTHTPETDTVPRTVYSKDGKNWVVPSSNDAPVLNPIVFNVTCTQVEPPQTPAAPGHDNLTRLIGDIAVNCTNNAATHTPRREVYTLLADSYTTGNVEGTADTGYTVTVTVNAEKYVTQFDTDTSATHTPKNGSQVVTLKYENDAWTVKEGKPVSFDVTCVAQPTFDELKEIFNQRISVECTTKPAHTKTPYDLIAGSYNIEEFSTMMDSPTCTVVLHSREYVKLFNGTTKAVHTPENEDKRVGLVLRDSGWGVANDDLSVVFQVSCVPDAPTERYLKDLLNQQVKVTCADPVHAPAVYELLADSYRGSGVQPDGNGGYTYTVTIAAAEYVKRYNTERPKNHSLVKDEPAEKPVTLVWNAAEPKWRFADADAVPVNFNVECLYTVTYEDGENGSVFKPLSFTDLRKGDSTPTIEDPIRVGYEFAGWRPNVQKTVTGDATYTAQWEAVDTTFTVKYNDNVKGKAFKEQVYENLKYNEETPDFYGTPKRSGYTFTGWKPVVTDRVTKDVTYYAQWKSSSGKDKVPKTGDGQIVMILGSVLLFSFCGATAVCLNDRKRKQG